VKRCIEAFTEENDIVYDPFNGSGTTTLVSKKMNRQYIGSDISQKYCEVALSRINDYVSLVNLGVEE
jgi:DNA modification methylase